MTPPAIHHLVSWSRKFDVYIVACDDRKFYVSVVSRQRLARLVDRNAVRCRTSSQATTLARSLARKL